MIAKRNTLFGFAAGFALSAFIGVAPGHADSFADKTHSTELSRVPSPTPPIGKNALVVIVKFRLSRSGCIEGTPTVTARGGTQVSQARAKKSALNTVYRSQPFSLPPQKYSGGWDNVEMTFHPEQ